MQDFDENNITDALIDRFTNTPDPRLKTIMNSPVYHLHDFVRDVGLTSDECWFAIDFLTRTGQICSSKRQEFILLSDTLGISMLVDAMNHRIPEGATATPVLGPFYVKNPPEFQQGFDISRNLPGEKLFVQANVWSAADGPLANAVIDVWQSDTDRFYDVQRDDLHQPTLRGWFRADSQGRLYFWSILPSPYPIPNDGPVGPRISIS
jgi:protocatechuate 3,4-dioxygenase beta subunit